jgi:hypothetical protein
MNSHNRIKAVLTFVAMVMAIVILATSPASAALVLEEQFIYEAGDINGRDGGTGFDGPWVSTQSHGRHYETGITAFAGGGGSILNEDAGLYFETVPVAGSALSRYGSAGRAEAHRTLSIASQTALTADNTTIWFSVFIAASQNYKNMMLVFGTEAFNTDGFQLAAAGDGFGVATADVDGNGDGPINAFVFDNNDVATFVVSTFSPAIQSGRVHHDTALIVGKINWKPNGTPDELFLFNITDLSAEPGEGTAIASITDRDLDQSAFDTIAMYDGNNSIVDEIRFGNNFTDVQIVADPSLPTVDAGGNWITWSGKPVTSNSTVINNDDEPQGTLSYAWTADPASLADGNLTIDITNADQEDVTVEVTKAADTGDATVVTMTLAVTLEGKDPVESSMTIDVCDDSCEAAKATGTVTLDPSDFNTDCITSFNDIALMAVEWLVDYKITAPVAK